MVSGPEISGRGEGISPDRRKFLRRLLWAGLAGVAASLLSVIKIVVPQKSGGYTPTVQAGDVLVFAEESRKGEIVRLENLAVGDSVLAYPKGKEANSANIIRLIREKPDLFQPPTRIEWTDQGVVGYSAICTHLSCTVSWDKAAQLTASTILCHCHNGVYDPLRGARVIAGPPPRPLSQIAVKVGGDGTLTLAGDFSGPVGPVV